MGDLGEAEYGSAAEMMAAYKKRVRLANPYKPVELKKPWCGVKRIVEEPLRHRTKEPELEPEPVAAEPPPPPPAVDDLVTPKKHSHEIIALVGKAHGVSHEEILGPRRSLHIIGARHHAMVTLYHLKSNLSLPGIGRLFRKDHSTVLHAVRTWPERKHLYARQIAEVEAAL